MVRNFERAKMKAIMKNNKIISLNSSVDHAGDKWKVGAVGYVGERYYWLYGSGGRSQ